MLALITIIFPLIHFHLEKMLLKSLVFLLILITILLAIQLRRVTNAPVVNLATSHCYSHHDYLSSP